MDASPPTQAEMFSYGTLKGQSRLEWSSWFPHPKTEKSELLENCLSDLFAFKKIFKISIPLCGRCLASQLERSSLSAARGWAVGSWYPWSASRLWFSSQHHLELPPFRLMPCPSLLQHTALGLLHSTLSRYPLFSKFLTEARLAVQQK